MAPKLKMDPRLERAKKREEFLRRTGETKARAQDALLKEDIKNVELGVMPTNQAQVDNMVHRLETQNMVKNMQALAREGDSLAGGGVAGNVADTGATDSASTVPQAMLELMTTATTASEATGEAGLHRGVQMLMTDEELEARLAKGDFAHKESEEDRRKRRVEELENQAEKISAQRKSLPIFNFRQELLDLVHKNQVVVIIGETGSGKTTQITQYLMEDGFTKPCWWNKAEQKRYFEQLEKDEEEQQQAVAAGGRKAPGSVKPKTLRVACTQPRRIAATSVAERVAQEAGVRLGDEVGYKVRFDDKSSQKTEIIYLTDGMMLKELVNDPQLDHYSVIMIDEAHERSLQTDVLLGLIKDICRSKPHLRIIVASATLEAKKFQQFFNNCPLFTIKGRTFDVETFYSNEPVEDYVFESAQQVINIHLERELDSKTGSDILVFLPGQDDIERCNDMLKEFVTQMGDEMRPLLVFPIYSTLPPNQQKLIYTKAPEGTRKVVIATNIAETSITVDGIVYVIDCGLCKQNRFNPVSMMEELTVVPTSKASAEQRKGRAGRTKEGVCVRLFTKMMYENELETETIPEIMRSNLSSVVLNLLSIGVSNLVDFDFLDAPSQQALAASLDHLHTLGAIDDNGQLTEGGRKISEFPLDPSLSKCIVSSEDLGVPQQMAIATALMSVENSIFISQPQQGGADAKNNTASSKRQLFGHHCSGDIVGFVRVFEEWQRQRFSERWCDNARLNYKTLIRARDIRDQTINIMDRLGMDLGVERNKESPLTPHEQNEAITRCLCRGFFTNVAKLDADMTSYVIVRPMGSMGGMGGRNLALPPIAIHPTSIHSVGTLSAVDALRKQMVEQGNQGKVHASMLEKPELVVFNQIRQTTKAYMMLVTEVADPAWLLEAAPGKLTEQDLQVRVKKRTRNVAGLK